MSALPATIGADPTDIATSNTSCRILVISPSPLQATTFIRRIQALGENPVLISEEVGSSGSEKDLLSPDLVKIPWTIQNKYYSADVHFAVHPVRGLAPYLLQNVPAVIFVWGSNEGYKHHIERLSRDLGGHEPEVSLAVRVGPSSDGLPDEPVDEEEAEGDNTAIDGFVSNYGFEYVDATHDVADRRKAKLYDDADGDEDDDGIPNLPRVLDALSTIMWPSMKAREKGSRHVQAQRDPSLFEWGVEGSQDHSLSLADDLMAGSSSQLSTRAGRMQSEMEELTRWLQNDVHDSDRGDPWKIAINSDSMVTSPTETGEGFFDKLSSQEKHKEQEGASVLQQTNLAKFDDDFTVFVSAPAVQTEGFRQGSGRSTPTGDGAEDQDGLKPFGGLRSYNSLGSVSDFGESEGEAKNVTSDDEGEDLPTREEILETSSRIFGMRGELRPTEDPQKTDSAEPYIKLGDSEAELEDADEYDMAPFDLSRVLGALQQMKEEISGMESEDERRKAAARVALGLVYGLEAEGDFN
ncbi:hypothetical protein P691DRAFT_798012 [Macrolepiota fuliginosa MF-IS2]|uniref:Uncharacterized protein n=1 Tax=Macrolepiota fuliginosa MF-IS2 TaxID=1400762 RepID=A0A9P5XIU9_9AGAR|nr:hypothetical protein P691DRAFT_798012 [Macrolepiota fuliginosa MF-IS2]